MQTKSSYRVLKWTLLLGGLASLVSACVVTSGDGNISGDGGESGTTTDTAGKSSTAGTGGSSSTAGKTNSAGTGGSATAGTGSSAGGDGGLDLDPAGGVAAEAVDLQGALQQVRRQGAHLHDRRQAGEQQMQGDHHAVRFALAG